MLCITLKVKTEITYIHKQWRLLKELKVDILLILTMIRLSIRIITQTYRWQLLKMRIKKCSWWINLLIKKTFTGLEYRIASPNHTKHQKVDLAQLTFHPLSSMTMNLRVIIVQMVLVEKIHNDHLIGLFTSIKHFLTTIIFHTEQKHDYQKYYL